MNCPRVKVQTQCGAFDLRVWLSLLFCVQLMFPSFSFSLLNREIKVLPPGMWESPGTKEVQVTAHLHLLLHLLSIGSLHPTSKTKEQRQSSLLLPCLFACSNLTSIQSCQWDPQGSAANPFLFSHVLSTCFSSLLNWRNSISKVKFCCVIFFLKYMILLQRRKLKTKEA